MVSWILSRVVVLLFGMLYPAYASYKAVKTKNIREYVRWMMYWIVFALFMAAETITDIFLPWLPFYYELKTAFVLWLLSPYTRGAGLLYRRFVHPTLSRKEKEIDSCIVRAREQSYAAVLHFGRRGLNIAATAAVHAATKSQGALAGRLRSFSMQDLRCAPDETPLHYRDPLYMEEEEEEQSGGAPPVCRVMGLESETDEEEEEEEGWSDAPKAAPHNRDPRPPPPQPQPACGPEEGTQQGGTRLGGAHPCQEEGAPPPPGQLMFAPPQPHTPGPHYGGVLCVPPHHLTSGFVPSAAAGRGGGGPSVPPPCFGVGAGASAPRLLGPTVRVTQLCPPPEWGRQALERF